MIKMYIQKVISRIAGSGYISQRHGSEDPDPDPHQNGKDPEHCYEYIKICCIKSNLYQLGEGGNYVPYNHAIKY